MSKARLVITAVVLEGRAPGEVARTYGVARSWVYALVARYRTDGEAAFEARSRRARSRPDATPTSTVELVVELRRQLSTAGLDAGADTIVWHLAHHHQITLSRATVYRIMKRADLVTAEPAKRPTSSYIRFQAEQPNECWQADFTHWRLADGTDTEILTWLDDHSRYALSVTGHARVTGPIVVNTFRAACARYGPPASTLTDNGMVFTTRLSGGRGGRNGFEAELVRLGIIQKNSRPNHPTTCGKVERFQQTLKRWLCAQPAPATIEDLQVLLDRFMTVYNLDRPHRPLPHQATPATIYNARPKATPTGRDDTHWRVRHDIVDTGGRVSLRVNGQLHHIGLGRTLARTRVIVLIEDLDIRVINAATGELYRQLTLDPTRDYQPTGRPPGNPGRKTRQPEPQ